MRAAGAGASATCFFFLRFFFDGVAASSVKTFMGDGAGAAAFSRIAASLRSTCARVVALVPLARHRRGRAGEGTRATNLGVQRPHEQQQIDRVALSHLTFKTMP